MEPGMTKATEGEPSFVQRSADGNTIFHQWASGIARILATMPVADENEGTPQKRQTRGMVSTTKGAYACLVGACGHGCGTPNVGDHDDRCIQCTNLHMTLGDTQVGWRVREAVQHMHALPWYEKPKVYKSPEVCTFRQVASPTTRAKMTGMSDWEVVQRAFEFAPYNPALPCTRLPLQGRKRRKHRQCAINPSICRWFISSATTAGPRSTTPKQWCSGRATPKRRRPPSGRGSCACMTARINRDRCSVHLVLSSWRELAQ